MQCQLFLQVLLQYTTSACERETESESECQGHFQQEETPSELQLLNRPDARSISLPIFSGNRCMSGIIHPFCFFFVPMQFSH